MRTKTKTVVEQYGVLRAKAAELLERADQRAASIMEFAEGKAALLRERGDAACGKVKRDAMASCIHWLKLADSADESAVTFAAKARAAQYRDMAQKCEDRGKSGAEEAREVQYLKAESMIRRAALYAKAQTDSLRQRAARLTAEADKIQLSFKIPMINSYERQIKDLEKTLIEVGVEHSQHAAIKEKMEEAVQDLAQWKKRVAELEGKATQ